jgi:hypothetical protein
MCVDIGPDRVEGPKMTQLADMARIGSYALAMGITVPTPLLGRADEVIE